MSSSSVPSPIGDLTDLTSASGSEDLATLFGRPKLEEIRRTHAPEEAYLKAVGLVNYLYVILFGSSAAYLTWMTYSHLTGKVSAAWSVRSGWIAFQANLWVTALLALIAGFGFRRLKSWALWVEAWVVPCCLTLVPASVLAGYTVTTVGSIAAGCSLIAAFTAPLLNLLDSMGSSVLTPEYRRVIAATPGVHVRAKLPWALKLPALLFLAIYLIICTFMAALER